MTTLILLFLYQSVSTTAPTIRTETTSPATLAMDTLNAAITFYLISRVHQLKTNLSCGTTLREDVNLTPLPVIQHMYYIEENFW